MANKLFWIDEAESIFYILQGALARTKAPISIVYIIPETKEALFSDEQVLEFIRKADVVFHDTDKAGWWGILPNSGRKEVAAFLKRMKTHFNIEEPSPYHVVVTEVRDPQASLIEIVKAIKTMPKTEETSTVNYVDGPWTKGSKSTIKVSLVVDEPIIREVLKRSVSTIRLDHFDIELQEFEDGLAFESSEWHKSAHSHLVVLDDVLPKKNGMEVVHFLRNQASNQKFHIFMLTDRVSEENLITAYQMGIDEMIHKPFNLRLFESLFRRTIERLWFE